MHTQPHSAARQVPTYNLLWLHVRHTESPIGCIPFGYDQAADLLGRPHIGNMVMSQEDRQKQDAVMWLRNAHHKLQLNAELLPQHKMLSMHVERVRLILLSIICFRNWWCVPKMLLRHR